MEAPPPPRIRMTVHTRAVLDTLLGADPAAPPWGYRICEITGMGPGTVYPILDRLERAGWVAGGWEEPPPVDRKQRRLYTVTAHGRTAYDQALASKGRRAWLPRLVWGKPDAEGPR